MGFYLFDGRRPHVPADSFVHFNAILVGDFKIGHKYRIYFCVSIRMEFRPVTTGNRSNVQDNSVIHVYPDSRVIVEEDVTIAYGTILHDFVMKSRCVISISAILFFNYVCEKNVFMSVGSIVPGEVHIPEGKVVSNNPAKITHDVTDEQKLMAIAGIDHCNIREKYIATMKKVI